MQNSEHEKEARLSLARQKLKKFQKKKAGNSDQLETSSVGEASSEIPDNFSSRSSPVPDLNAFSMPSSKSSDLLGSDSTPYSLHSEIGRQHSRSFSVDENPITGKTLSLPHVTKVGNGAPFEHPEHPFDITRESRRTSTQSSVNEDEVRVLKRNMEDLMQANQRLRSELDAERSSMENRILREHQSLREQLNGHIQTIGILVAEKTELQAALNHADSIAKKKAMEVSSYAEKLADMHQKISEYERRLNENNLHGEHQVKQHLQTQAIHTAELTEARQRNALLERNLEELRDETFELRKRLNVKDAETKQFEEKASYLESQLHLF